MSIKLNAQSGGSVALDAPTQTTSSADNVYKLPVADGSAGQVLTTDGSGNLSWVTQPTAGITMADQWRVYNSQSVSGNSTTNITSWQRNNNNFAGIGSAMTNSTHEFTFPSTGIYFVAYTMCGMITSGNARYLSVRLVWNNDDICHPFASMEHYSHETLQMVGSHTILDVTSTSQVLRFASVSDATHTIIGNQQSGYNGAVNHSEATFIRLGDT